MITASLESPREASEVIGVFLLALGLVSFLWLPLAFITYAIGLNQSGTVFLPTFITVEAVAIYAAVLIYRAIEGFLP